MHTQYKYQTVYVTPLLNSPSPDCNSQHPLHAQACCHVYTSVYTCAAAGWEKGQQASYPTGAPHLLQVPVSYCCCKLRVLLQRSLYGFLVT